MGGWVGGVYEKIALLLHPHVDVPCNLVVT